MSALTAYARRGKSAPPPVPWRRMVWVTWRQHRVALAGTGALFTLLAAYVSIAGAHLHRLFAAARACHPATSIACGELTRRFNDANLHLANGFVWQPVPALVGAFVAAPVLARELETGTFRYAWTQGFGRLRWTVAKLVLLAVPVTAAAGAFSVLLHRYYAPYFAVPHSTVFLSQTSPLSAGLFDLRGVAFAAWTLVAFAIGALAGVFIRRVVPAIVATLAAYSVLALTVPLFVRAHYMAPLLSARSNVPATASVISQWWTKDGRFAFTGLPPMNLIEQFCNPVSAGGSKPSPASLAQCLSHHGYIEWTRYQPAGRFWSFQLIEGSWLVALSAVLITATVWIVRRGTA